MVIKNLLSAILVTGFLLVPLYPVFAQFPTIKLPAGAPLDSSSSGIASRSAQLRLKVATFRNKTKADLLLKISDNLNTINQKRTDEMMKRLEMMTQLVGKLQNIIAQDPNNPALSKSQSSLEQATTAINNAKSAVSAQAELDYTINVASEAGIKADAQAARGKLFTDLRTTNEQVIQARQTLSTIIQTTITSLKGGTNGQQ